MAGILEINISKENGSRNKSLKQNNNIKENSENINTENMKLGNNDTNSVFPNNTTHYNKATSETTNNTPNNINNISNNSFINNEQINEKVD